MENNKIKKPFKNFFENYCHFESNLKFVKMSLTWFLLSLIITLLIGIGIICFSNKFFLGVFAFLFIGGTITSVITLIYLFFNVGILIGDIYVKRDWDK